MNNGYTRIIQVACTLLRTGRVKYIYDVIAEKWLRLSAPWYRRHRLMANMNFQCLRNAVSFLSVVGVGDQDDGTEDELCSGLEILRPQYHIPVSIQ